MNLNQAHKLAHDLMTQHGLVVNGWSFTFDNAKRRFGVCRYRTKTIGLSEHLVALNEMEKVKDVILHEIAHALTAGHGHDGVWKAKAIEIGCDGNRCYGNETVTPAGNYKATCVNCGQTFAVFRMPKRNHWCRCNKRKFDIESKLIWISHK